MQLNIKTLIDDVQCYDTVRELRWPEGRQCAFCESRRVIKRGFDEKETAKQRYECKECGRRFDDLTGTIFAGHHQPLKVWILCLYFMEGFWSLLRGWLRPHRGISQEKLPLYLGFFEFIHNVGKPGKALIHSLVTLLIK